MNLGLFQHDVSVIWDLAPHDLAIMDHVIGKEPEAVVATGSTHFGQHADIALPITMVHDREIVRRQVPDHAHVVLEKPQVDPRRIVVVETAQDALVDELAGSSARRR